MEKEKDIFRFEDFVDVEKLTKMKSNLIKEGIINDYEEIDHSLNPYTLDTIKEDIDYDQVNDYLRQSYGDSAINNIEDFENSKYYSGTKETDKYSEELKKYLDLIRKGEDSSEEENEDVVIESVESDNNYYKLYKDKAEDFRCDIAVEGVNQSDTEVRLIVESDEWTLMFVGEIKNGQCVIPMKKLSILNEGTKGSIRLEVNADGTLFTPWEDKFVVKASKKVTVSLNENNTNKKESVKTGVSVKVNK